MPKLTERIVRLDLTELENMLRTAGFLEKSEQLNDVHIEPGELVLRFLSDNKKQ